MYIVKKAELNSAFSFLFKCVFCVKAVFAKGRQRYLCKPCNYYYTVTQKSNVKSSAIRHMAFDMYLEDMGFRAICRVLKISYGTVFIG